jgi:hypothetical protein
MSNRNHLRNGMLATAAALTIACTALAALDITANQEVAPGSSLFQADEDVGAVVLAQSKFGPGTKWKGKGGGDNDDDDDEDPGTKNNKDSVRSKSKCPPGQESVGHGRYAACMIAR